MSEDLQSWTPAAVRPPDIPCDTFDLVADDDGTLYLAIASDDPEPAIRLFRAQTLQMAWEELPARRVQGKTTSLQLVARDTGMALFTQQEGAEGEIVIRTVAD